MSTKRIVFVSKGLNASSTRYRALDFFSLFMQEGYRPSHLSASRNPANRLQLLFTAARNDIVVLVRRTYGLCFIWLLRLVSRKLIFTFDDAIFCKSDGSPSRKRARRFTYTVKASNIVWAGNRYLAEKALEFNSNVELMHTAIDPEKYQVFAKKPDDKLDLVWIGSHSTKKHLLTIMPALEAAAKAIPRLRLKIIADFSIESPTLEILPVPWSEESEAKQLVSAHIGIAPLPDNTYTRGKCGLKVLQYMAAGLPVISSPTGVNKEMVQPGKTGFLAGTTEEWVAAIDKLNNDQMLRETIGNKARAFCEENFALTVVFNRMLSSLKHTT